MKLTIKQLRNHIAFGAKTMSDIRAYRRFKAWQRSQKMKVEGRKNV